MEQTYKRLYADSALFGYSIFSREKLTKIVEETIELINAARKNGNLTVAESRDDYSDTRKRIDEWNNWMLLV